MGAHGEVGAAPRGTPGIYDKDGYYYPLKYEERYLFLPV